MFTIHSTYTSFNHGYTTDTTDTTECNNMNPPISHLPVQIHPRSCIRKKQTGRAPAQTHLVAVVESSGAFLTRFVY